MRDLEIRGAGQPARRRAVGPRRRGRLRALLQMLDEAVAVRRPAAGSDRRRGRWEPVRLDVPVDAYVPRRLHPLRGRQDRRAPPDRGARASRRTWSAIVGGARGPLRPAPGAGREPRAAPGGPHQARAARARGRSSSAASGSSSPRSSSTPAQATDAARGGRRASSTSRSSARCGSGCRDEDRGALAGGGARRPTPLLSA